MASGETLRKICDDDHMPSEAAVRLWASDDREGFSAQYARAREALVEFMADEILEIADDSKNDTVTDEDGTDRANTEWIARSKVRIDTRKWLLSKVLPKKYGEKLELSGDPAKPLIPVVNVTIGATGIKPSPTPEAG